MSLLPKDLLDDLESGDRSIEHLTAPHAPETSSGSVSDAFNMLNTWQQYGQGIGVVQSGLEQGIQGLQGLQNQQLIGGFIRGK